MTECRYEINVRKLYKMFGSSLTYCTIKMENEYCDLLVKKNIVCTDGEQCRLKAVSFENPKEKEYELYPVTGGINLMFVLTEEEFRVAIS